MFMHRRLVNTDKTVWQRKQARTKKGCNEAIVSNDNHTLKNLPEIKKNETPTEKERKENAVNVTYFKTNMNFKLKRINGNVREPEYNRQTTTT